MVLLGFSAACESFKLSSVLLLITEDKAVEVLLLLNYQSCVEINQDHKAIHTSLPNEKRRIKFMANKIKSMIKSIHKLRKEKNVNLFYIPRNTVRTKIYQLRNL